MGRSISDLYGAALRRFTRRTFGVWQRLGVHVTANHFYEPVPDTRRLPADWFDRDSDLPGIDMNERGQLDLLAKVAAFRDEYAALPRKATGVAHEFFLENGSFQNVDAEVFWGIVRHFRPRRIVEIGSGNSTYLAAAALKKNGGGELIAIEPYPERKSPPLTEFPGLTRLVRSVVQEVPLSEFTALGENDILFIDSSHVLSTGSDVQREFLDILPRLKKGVIVHVHDIYLPREYPKEWVVGDRRFFTEQYLLQAFLAFNSAFEVLFAGSWMHRRHPQALAAAIPSYDPQRVLPGSFWLRRTRD